MDTFLICVYNAWPERYLQESPITSLPYITPDFEGIGGEIKSEPSHFKVEEIPLYEPEGKGDHVYLRVSREGKNTRDLVLALSDSFGLKESDIGCAGQKDKHAVAIQTFSVYLPHADDAKVLEQARRDLPGEVLWAKRHVNKLKTGHLLGNRFTIVLAEPKDGALSDAEKIARAIRERGLPNYYGPQRFGADGDNAEKGRAVLDGKGPRKKWMRNFLLSAFQSQLFNNYLAERIRRDWFGRILTGDIAKKTDTGGMFQVDDEETDTVRFQAGEITYTGPMFGKKMKAAGGEPGALEQQILDDSGVTTEMMKKAGMTGTRRPARLLIPELTVTPGDLGLLFDFALPKGSYATVLLREFTKGEDLVISNED